MCAYRLSVLSPLSYKLFIYPSRSSPRPENKLSKSWSKLKCTTLFRFYYFTTFSLYNCTRTSVKLKLNIFYWLLDWTFSMGNFRLTTFAVQLFFKDFHNNKSNFQWNFSEIRNWIIRTQLASCISSLTKIMYTNSNARIYIYTSE